MIKQIDSNKAIDLCESNLKIAMFLFVDWAFQSTVAQKKLHDCFWQDDDISIYSIDVSSQNDKLLEKFLKIDKSKPISLNKSECIEAYTGGNGSLILVENSNVKFIYNRIHGMSNDEIKERIDTFFERK